MCSDKNDFDPDMQITMNMVSCLVKLHWEKSAWSRVGCLASKAPILIPNSNTELPKSFCARYKCLMVKFLDIASTMYLAL
jgi:hypothetical protein